MMRSWRLLRFTRIIAYSAIATGLSSSASFAGEFKVENYSNQAIHIAVAFEQGQTVSVGWYTLTTTQTKVFQTPDNSRMFFRIEQDQPQGQPRELTYNVPTETYPAIRSRFEVKNAPDDPSIRFLRWGQNYENVKTVDRNAQQLPEGWGYVRFHRVDAGNSKLEIK